MCILYEIRLNFGMARCQVVKMWCAIKLHRPQFNSICLTAPLYFTLSVINAGKHRHKKNIPVCNVDKPTTEEWTRGRHWHQTDTTEINGHKRSSQEKKTKKKTTHSTQSLPEPGLDSSHCACRRPRTARQTDSRKEMDEVPGACVDWGHEALITHHWSLQHFWVYLFIYT